MWLSFFCNATATTEIYTYWTHSFPTRRSSDLHENRHLERQLPENAPAAGTRLACRQPGGCLVPAGTQAHRRQVPHRCRPRSEEHTSELQSLMRTSYAVFRLTTKTQNTNQ